jgi:tripartite-type tricarboxylate transporter receptor subunit TctC
MKKVLSFLLLLTLLVVVFTGSAFALGNYPSKDITLVVGFGAGGATDLIVRPFAEVFAQKTGVNVIVENVTGASGAVAAQQMLTEKPDGYRLLIGAAPNMVIMPIAANLGYSYENFTLISQLTNTPIAIAVRSDSPYNTLDEFVAAAKEKPLTYSSGGANSTDQLAMESIAREKEVTFSHMPFDGGAAATAALLGGHVDSTVGNLPDVSPQYDAGTLKILAVFADERLAVLPDVPCIKELGYDNMAFGTITSIVAPAGMNEEMMKYLEEKVKETMDDPKLQEVWNKMNVFAEYLDSEGLLQKYTNMMNSFQPLILKQMEGSK